MKTRARIIAAILAMLIIVTASSCAGERSQEHPHATVPEDTTGGTGREASTNEDGQTAPNLNGAHLREISTDREGNRISLPDKIERVVSIGPSCTEILVGLGLGDMIIATDTFSENIAGIKPGISNFDMLFIDGEQLIVMQPDIVFVAGLSKATIGDDPFGVISNAGICVVYIPTSTSIEGIKDDIRFVAAVMGAQEKGQALIEEMGREIDSIRAIGHTVTDKKSVYFEISAAPWMYSFGSGVFLNEMIEIIGAVNIFEQLEGWHLIADEAVLNANPDIIFTTVNYIEDPVGEIKSRPGWNGITAVRNGNVYFIDTDASNRPSHNIVIALREMAEAAYPELFTDH